MILDNSRAYDRVQWDFMQETMAAFGIPPAFCSMVAAMYKKSSVRLRINGSLGPRIEMTAGLKQGCCCSCALFVLCMEVLLRSIRADPAIEGIRIPGPDGSDAPDDRAGGGLEDQRAASPAAGSGE